MIGASELSGDDVRRVLRLVGELREVGAESLVWRAHLMRSLRRSLGARVVLDAETKHRVEGPSSFYESSDLGYEDGPRVVCLRYFYEPDRSMLDPLWLGLARHSEHDYTYLRAELVGDRDWYGSKFVNEIRLWSGIDDGIFSNRVIPRLGCNHMLAIQREPGDSPLTERDRQEVALLHDELAHLWRAQPPPGLPPLAPPLSPALRTTLALLMEGEGEKQVAARLGISRHAVHDRVKRLHRQFDVRSRGELLATAWRSRAVFRPRLEVERGAPRAVRWFRIEDVGTP